MARKKDATEIETAANTGAVNASEFEDIFNFDSLNPALETIKAELQITGDADVTVHVSKLNADENGTEMNVWRGDPDSYDLEQIAKKFGSGQYRVMVYMRIPSGQKVRKLNKVMAWLLSPEDEQRRKSGNAPQTVAGNDTSNVIAVLQQMQRDNLAAQERMIAAIAQRPDPMKQMKDIADVVKTIAPNAPAAQQGMGLTEVLSLTKTIIDLGKANAPSPVIPEGADLSGVALSKGIDLVGKFLEQAQKGQMQPAVAQLPAPQQPPQEMPDNETSEEAEMIKMYLKLANYAAKTGQTPDEFAEENYTRIPDNMFELFATDPQWFQYLIKFVPECANFRPWYEQVRNRLIAIAKEDGLLTPEGKLRSVDESQTDGAAQNGDPVSVNDPSAGGTKTE